LLRKVANTVTDKSTAGHTASPDEVERMMRNLCAFALTEPDPMQRYLDLTHQQVVFDGVAAVLKRERGRALADLLEAGVPISTLMESTQLTQPMIKSLVSGAGRHMPSGGKQNKDKTKARPKPVEVRLPEPAPTPTTVPAPRQQFAPNGTRLLTPDERVALGLTPHGPIARANTVSAA
jgi:hypothetical protein